MMIKYYYIVTFQPNQTIQWKMHFASPVEKVYTILATDEGRSKFWAEKTREAGNILSFFFSNGYIWQGKILESIPSKRFCVDYIGHTLACFELLASDDGGTDMMLTNRGVSDDDRSEVIAGWGSVLMAMKAAVDFGVDLRNHDSKRTWDQGFFEN